MSYINKVLSPGEEVIYMGSVSIWSLLTPLIIGFVFIMFGYFHYIPIILGFFVLCSAMIQFLTTELSITNRRVVSKFGFIERSTVEINIARVESVQVQQCILGRIFNFGTIIISGAGTPQAPIPGISSPLVFRRVFMETQDKMLDSVRKHHIL